MLSKPAQKVVSEVKARRNEQGQADISSKEVAILIRSQLKTHFPETKFSVTSDYNSVNIRWQDGPTSRQVDSIVDNYSFGGFDGMIDLAYCSDNWLLPDGTMLPAACSGTQSSMGTVPAYATDCPQPGAVLVKRGPRYVFTHREITNDRYMALAWEVQNYYGYEVDWNTEIWNQRFGSEYLTELCRKLEIKISEGEVQPLNQL